MTTAADSDTPEAVNDPILTTPDADADTPTSARYVRVLIFAAVVAAVWVGAYTAASVVEDMVRTDKYDEDARRTSYFGQRISPDGDVCWREYKRAVCDLESIGGLHWSPGNMKTEASSDVYLGSGYLCLVDLDGKPWCWDWSAGTPPQPAQAPANVALARFMGDGGLMCGQTRDNKEIVCWTAGAGHIEYRQATHRFRVDTEWSLISVYDNPPNFGVALPPLTHPATGPAAVFDAFTGEVRSEWDIDAASLLATETMS